MFKPEYRECFVVCDVIEKDGEFMLDLPFPITSREVILFGKNFMSDIPKFSVEVLAHITYAKEYHNEAVKFDGYIADNSTAKGRRAILTHARYSEFWSMKMSEYLGTYDSEDNLIPYTGADANDPALCCVFLRSDYEDR